MPIRRNSPEVDAFNQKASLPFELRLVDFRVAMQDVYDFFFDVNTGLVDRGLDRLDDMLRPAMMSGLLSRKQCMCVFVYAVDNTTEPAVDRRPITFTELYLGQVSVDDFRKNSRGELGTRTATLHAAGIKRLRESWVYRAPI